jgi:hypothetical protein
MNYVQMVRLLEKSFATEIDPDRMLAEGSIRGLIVEQIDESDIKAVKRSIDKARESVATITKYFDDLGVDKSDVQSVYDYAQELEDALDKAQGMLAGASFDRGAIMNFFGEKLTLPQITRASISLLTRAKDFASGVSKAVDNVKNNLAPLLKNADKNSTLTDAAGEGGVPDLRTLQSGMQKAMDRALKQNMTAKIGAFFNKVTSTGAEKKIMDSMPSRDLSAMGSDIAAALLSAPISKFEKAAPPPPPSQDDSKALGDVAQDAAEPTGGKESGEAGGKESGEDAKLPDKDKTAADEQADKISKAVGNKISKKELTQILKGLPDIAGQGDKATRSRRTFRKLINQAAGKEVFEESFNRWKELAGIE